MYLDRQDCIFSLIQWSKTGPERDHTEIRRAFNAEGMEKATDWYSRVGVACPIILQARGDGSRPISGKGKDLCQRHGMYPIERQTGYKTET